MSVDGGFFIEMRHYSDMGSEVVLTLNADVAGDLAMALDPLDRGWAELSAELLEAVVDIDRSDGCTHDREGIAKSGRICLHCLTSLKAMHEEAK